MPKKRMQFGVCHLCKKSKDLTFEHIPPKVAFNSQTRYRTVPFIEFAQNSHKPEYKPKGPIKQGGMGSYSLCKSCNNFLGQQYVSSYFIMASAAANIFKSQQIESVGFYIEGLYPLKLLKQVVSMFISINEPYFTEAYPELLDFVKLPKSQNLPDRYKIYMYLNKQGSTRHNAMMVHSHYGIISEVTFPPLGFVLNIDRNDPLDYLFDITHFKNFSPDYNGVTDFMLNNLPTHIGYISGDYRSKEEIDETIKRNEKFMDE
ncbi:MAG: hypothetical protein ACO1N9_01525 [Flavobacterium sp.]